MALAFATATLFAANDARADDAALAQALFDEGRTLFEAGRFEEACTKFAGSHDAEPSVGALLNLARCHEKTGQTASAWAEYRAAAAMARREGQDKRVAGALDHADRLEPGLSRLTVAVERTVPGLEVTRSGEELPSSSWDTAVPVDPGTYTIEARAPGHAPWRGEVTVGGDADTATLRIPALEPGDDETEVTPAADGGLSGLDVAAIASGSVGLACLAVGGALGAVALSQRADLGERCGDDDVCEAPVDLASERSQIESIAHGSTAMFVVGGVGLGAAATLLLISALGDDTARDDAAPTVGLMLGVDGGAVTLGHRF